MFQVILHFATLLHIANKPSTNTQIHTVWAEDVCSTVPCRLYQKADIQTGSKQHRASHASGDYLSGGRLLVNTSSALGIPSYLAYMTLIQGKARTAACMLHLA